MWYLAVWTILYSIVVGASLTTSQVATKAGYSSSAGVVHRERCSSVARPISMAAATVGRMEQFDPDNESIVVYLERMQLYFEVNGIKPEKQVPVFFSIIGRENYGLLRNLSAPEKPSEKSLKQLTDILKRHYEPKKVTIAARFQFHQWKQEPGETSPCFWLNCGRWLFRVSLATR